MAFLFPPRKSKVLTVHDLWRPKALLLKVWSQDQQQQHRLRPCQNWPHPRPTKLGILHVNKIPKRLPCTLKLEKDLPHFSNPPHYLSSPSDHQLAHTASLVFLLSLQHIRFFPAQGLCSDCSLYQNVLLPDICKPHFFTSTSSDLYSCKCP